jgi:hypothetical protein
MAGTTPNLGMYLPGGGSTGTYTPDEVADIDPLNQNFVKLDTFAGTVGNQTNRNQQYYGPAAAITNVTGQKLGDEYQESDGNKRLWRYDGSNWASQESGLIRIRPNSVTQGSISPSGTVIVAAPDSQRVNIDGVFDFTKYRRYRILHNFRKNSPTSMSTWLYRDATTDLNGASYFCQAIYLAAGGQVSPSYQGSVTNMGGTFDAQGVVISSVLEVAGTDNGQSVVIYGQVTGRVGSVEMKTASANFDGGAASTIRGLGVSYGQGFWGQWTFYAYVE